MAFSASCCGQRWAGWPWRCSTPLPPGSRRAEARWGGRPANIYPCKAPGPFGNNGRDECQTHLKTLSCLFRPIDHANTTHICAKKRCTQPPAVSMPGLVHVRVGAVLNASLEAIADPVPVATLLVDVTKEMHLAGAESAWTNMEWSSGNLQGKE